MPPAGLAGRRGGAPGRRQRGGRRHRHQRRARRHPAVLLRRGRRPVLPLLRGGHAARALPERRGPLGLARQPRRARAARPHGGAVLRAGLGVGARRDARLAHAARALRHAPAGEPARAGHPLRGARAFRISDMVCQSIRERAPAFDDPEWRRVFVPGGVFPRPATASASPTSRATLTELADDPSSSTGAAWPAPSRPGSRREGFLTADDLAAHRASGASRSRPRTAATPSTRRRRPPRAWPRSSTLNLLEGFDLAALPVHSVEHLHLLLEMTKLAYADRDRWVADPAHGAGAGRGAARQGLRGRAARRLRPRQGAGLCGGRPRRRHHGLRGRRRARQRHQRHPERVQVVRLRRGRAGHRRGAPQPGRLLQHRSRGIRTASRRASARSTPWSPAWSRATARPCSATPRWAATGRRCSTPRGSPTCSTTAWRSRRPSSARASCTGPSIPGDAPRPGAHRGPRARRRARGRSRRGHNIAAGVGLVRADGPRPRHHAPRRHAAPAAPTRAATAPPTRLLMDAPCSVARAPGRACAGASGLLVRGRRWPLPAAELGRDRARRHHPRAGARALRDSRRRRRAPQGEGYDTMEWVYEGARAPRASTRHDRGLRTAHARRLQARVVRALTARAQADDLRQEHGQTAGESPTQIGLQGNQDDASCDR